MAYYQKVSLEDLMELISTLSKGNGNYQLTRDEDIKRFANTYFRYVDYDYFDILGSLNDPYWITTLFKWFSKINLELEPDDTQELNHRFIQFVCTRVHLASTIFCESTIKHMQYFVEDNIDHALSVFKPNFDIKEDYSYART